MTASLKEMLASVMERHRHYVNGYCVAGCYSHDSTQCDAHRLAKAMLGTVEALESLLLYDDEEFSKATAIGALARAAQDLGGER